MFKAYVHGMPLEFSELSSGELNRLLVELANELNARRQTDSGNYVVRAAAALEIGLARHSER